MDYLKFSFREIDLSVSMAVNLVKGVAEDEITHFVSGQKFMGKAQGNGAGFAELIQFLG